MIFVRTARVSLALVSVAALSGCLRWDVAIEEYCRGTPNPRPIECGERLIGLPVVGSTVIGEEFEHTTVALARVGDDVVLGANGAGASWVRKHGGGSPDLADRWVVQYDSTSSVKVSGLAGGADMVIVGGSYEDALETSAGGTGLPLITDAVGPERPFVHVLGADGQPLAFWTPLAGDDVHASVDVVAAVTNDSPARFAFVGRFTGSLQLPDGGAPLDGGTDPARPTLYGAVATLTADNQIQVSRSFTVSVSGNRLEAIDAAMTPDERVCVLIRVQGNLAIAPSGATFEFAEEALVLVCSGVLDSSPYVVFAPLEHDHARLSDAADGGFYLAASSAEGVFAGPVEVTNVVVNAKLSKVVSGPGFRVWGVDVSPTHAHGVVVGTYSVGTALPPGFRLAQPEGVDDVFALSVDLGPTRDIQGLTAFQQPGDGAHPIGVSIGINGIVALALRLDPSAPLRLPTEPQQELQAQTALVAITR